MSKDIDGVVRVSHNGFVWEVPIMTIAIDRASYYAELDGVSFKESLYDDTIPLFKNSDYEIIDWATGNMNWSDVKEAAELIKTPNRPRMEQHWVDALKVVKRA